MEPDAAASPPSRRRVGGTANVTGREYMGCGLWVAAFLVLVVLSFSVGLALRPDQGPRQASLTSGGTGDSAWVLVGGIDEDDEPCVRLFRPGEEDREGAEITGQCGFTDVDGGTYVITSAELADGTTVMFAPVPDGATTVRLHLADGSRPEVGVRHSDGADLSWFVHQADDAVDGPAQLLDAAGTVIDPP